MADLYATRCRCGHALEVHAGIHQCRALGCRCALFNLPAPPLHPDAVKLRDAAEVLERRSRPKGAGGRFALSVLVKVLRSTAAGMDKA